MLPLFLIAAAQAFDFVSFLAMVTRRGIAAEVNPLVQAIAVHHGLGGLTAAKVGVTLLATVTVLLLSRTHPRFAVVVLAVGTGAGIVGGVSNLAAL